MSRGLGKTQKKILLFLWGGVALGLSGSPARYFEILKSIGKEWKEIERQPLDDVKDREGENNTLFRLIRQEGLKREFPLILATLDAFSRGQVGLMNGIILNREGDFSSGKDLSREVEAALEVSH